MKKILLLMSLFALIGITTIKAQVSIGKLVPPDSSAVLQVISPDSTKGVLVPEMTQTQRDKIKKPADGLMIYNITENCYNYWNKPDSIWQSVCGGMGKALFLLVCDSGVVVNGTYGSGVALNPSNSIKVYVKVTRKGSYSIQASSNPDNQYFFSTSGTFYTEGGFYITIQGTGQPKNPTPADHFTLTSSSGTDSCKFDVPVIDTSIKPIFEISCASIQVQGAYFEDSVLTSKPNPIFDNNPNQIAVQLTNIPTTSFGAVATLQTNTVDGISFSWTGTLNSNPQTVYMQGTGTPRGLNDKVMTITSNSVSNPGSCTATVMMLIPRKRLMTLGNTTGPLYGYNAGIVDTRNPKASLNALLTDKDNFGYNQWSILKFAGFNNVDDKVTASNFIPTAPNNWVDDNRDIVAMETATWQAMTDTKLRELLFGTAGKPKIDVFMIGYDTDYFRGGTPTTANATDKLKCDVLVEWVKQGGILMICSEATDSNRNFMNLFFNGTPNPGATLLIDATTGSGAGSVYSLGFDLSNTPSSMRPYYCRDDDPILRGPFGDILGRTWGEDATSTRYLTNLPLEQVVIYSGARPLGTTAQPGDGVTLFRHRDFPLIFVGDGGFNSNEARTYTGATVCPFRLLNKTINGRTFYNYPSGRPSYGITPNAGSTVHNAVFTANAFAWCIMKAEEIRRAGKLVP